MEMLSFHRLRGTSGDQGITLGRELGHILHVAARARYLEEISLQTGVSPGVVRSQAGPWLDSLPAHVVEEVDGMALGASRAGVGPIVPLDIAEWLYADIAGGGGAACSAVSVEIDRRAWVARNCDWYPSQLLRGHSVVVHDHPAGSGRIPTMALGIAGDIDIDTGINAAGLWLHVHTMYATDAPDPAKPCLSWLFWAREALETCSTIDEVDALLGRVDRDRGMILVVVEAKTNARAVFECARSRHERHDAGPGFQCATNHPGAKQPRDPARLARSRAGGTILRRAAVESIASSHHEWDPPSDLFALLADPGVEMRDAKQLKTIYAAVCCPASSEVWFCAGAAPAASRGVWSRVAWPW